MNIVDFPQGSKEWRQAKAGRIGASNMTKVLSRSRDRKSEGATRADFKARIIAEILTGMPCDEDDFQSEDMEGGIEREPAARSTYEVRILKSYFVDQVGFVIHPKSNRWGCSPDGLVGKDGMVQIKCPKRKTHLAYRMAGVVPAKYEPQLVTEMEVCEREWSDFVSYCPDFPAPLDLFVVRLPRDLKRAQEITAEVTQFNREVDEIIEKLTGKPVAEYLDRLGMKEAVL